MAACVSNGKHFDVVVQVDVKDKQIRKSGYTDVATVCTNGWMRGRIVKNPIHSSLHFGRETNSCLM